MSQQPQVFQQPTIPQQQQQQVLQQPTLPQHQPQQPQWYTPEVQDTPQVTDIAQVTDPPDIMCVWRHWRHPGFTGTAIFNIP